MIGKIKKYIQGYSIMKNIESMKFYRLTLDMYLYDNDISRDDYENMVFFEKVNTNVKMYRKYEPKGLVKW